MNTVATKVDGKICTGCGGCENVCPVDAISMIADHEGFIVPSVNAKKCVDCRKCVSVCPALNTKHDDNYQNPEVYVVRANDNIRKMSSSGGVFTLIAERVIKNGGVVYGAAFDANMQLCHTSAETLKDLLPLKGSKYVQSSIGKTYRNIKKNLEKGKEVLFVGTPCQAAALKSYLAKNFDNLFIADLVCHGVPPQAILDKYLKEKFPNEKVIGIDFRNKAHGWNCTNIDITLSNGKIYSGSLIGKDSYEIIFHNNIGLRKSCSDCKFCEFPREGDITIGDFWGINKLDGSQNDCLGTSMVFVNNEHGRELLKSVASNAKIAGIPCEIKNIENRLKAKYSAHPGREAFFNLIKTMEVNKAVELVTENKHDIGLVGIYTVENFGGALTYYALYKTLCDMGYSVLMIERPTNARHKPASIAKIYYTSPYPRYDLAVMYPNKSAMTELNDICDKFVIGSDQLFNDFLYHQFGKWCTLDWVSDSRPKIAYAASFGHDHIWSTENVRAEMAYYMQKFDSFSVREESGVKVCADEFGVFAEQVLDPIFLCDPVYFSELANISPRTLPTNYIAGYILDPDKEKSDMINKVSADLGKNTDIYTEMHYTEGNLNGFSLPVNFGGKIEDRLASIINSDMVIADSFHGICMAIIFKKDFIAISNAKRGSERFQSILRILGLENRLVDNFDQLKERIKELTKPINYTSVYLRLDKERKRCLKWLGEAVSCTLKKSFSTYDILSKQISELSAKVNSLNEKNTKLTHITEIFARYAGFDLYLVNSIIPYFKAIAGDLENYIVAISVRDTPGMFLTKEISDAMSLIGINEDLVNKHWYGYAALIDKGKIIGEQCRFNEAVSINADIGGILFSVVSKPLNAGNSSVISINGCDYSINRRGLNIVVYDKTKHCVCDSVCFDTHVNSAECYR